MCVSCTRVSVVRPETANDSRNDLYLPQNLKKKKKNAFLVMNFPLRLFV